MWPGALLCDSGSIENRGIYKTYCELCTAEWALGGPLEDKATARSLSVLVPQVAGQALGRQLGSAREGPRPVWVLMQT